MQYIVRYPGSTVIRSDNPDHQIQEEEFSRTDVKATIIYSRTRAPTYLLSIVPSVQSSSVQSVQKDVYFRDRSS